MAAPYTHMSKVGKVVFEVSSFENEKSRHLKVIDDHCFNYGVSVVLPGCSKLPDFLTGHLCNEKAYLIQQLSLSHLIDINFIEAFVKRGDLYMLSHETKIDTEDCAALLPTGHLILNLTKDTYETLGLEGKASIHGGKKPGKFIVDINLTASHFTPGKKNYDRVKWCLGTLPLYFDFLVTWQPKDEKICGSSISVYFENKGFQVSQLNMKQTWKVHHDTDVPEVTSTILGDDIESCAHTMELYEWLGAILCNCNIAGGPDEYLSTLTCPTPVSQLKSCTSYRIEGMFTTSTLQKVVHSLRTYVKQRDSPWAAITVHGFADSPVSWQNREHGYHKSGENLYTYVVFPDQHYWLFMATDVADVCP